MGPPGGPPLLGPKERSTYLSFPGGPQLRIKFNLKRPLWFGFKTPLRIERD